MKSSDRPSTYAKVCEIEGVDPIESLPIKDPKTKEDHALNAMSKTWRILRVFRQGVKVNFNNRNQRKYTAWWDMRCESAGGSGFSYFGYSSAYSGSIVGARLTFLDYDDMMFVTSQPEFVEIFKTWMVDEE